MYCLVLAEQFLCLLKDGALLDFTGSDACIDSLLEFCQLVSHSSIEGNHRRSAVGRRAQCAEFKTVARKCEWRRTVAVGIVDKQFRNLRHVFQLHTLFCRECYVVVHIGVKQTVDNV